MAGSWLASLPVIAVFVFLQRQFIQGIAQTGIKG
jgi:multiple sugar transport system permease protein